MFHLIYLFLLITTTTTKCEITSIMLCVFKHSFERTILNGNCISFWARLLFMNFVQRISMIQSHFAYMKWNREKRLELSIGNYKWIIIKSLFLSKFRKKSFAELKRLDIDTSKNRTLKDCKLKIYVELHVFDRKIALQLHFCKKESN